LFLNQVSYYQKILDYHLPLFYSLYVSINQLLTINYDWTNQLNVSKTEIVKLDKKRNGYTWAYDRKSTE